MPPQLSQESHDHKQKLDRRLAHGIAWTAGAKWATQVLTWGSLLALARFLSPAEFGISAMAGTYFNLTNMLAEFGVGTAVLHMPELNRRSLGQLHAFSVLLCTAVAAVTLAIAPVISGFYRTPEVRSVIMVGCLAFFVIGFQAVPLGLLQRDMDYRKLSLAEAVQAIVQSAVSVLVAWFGGGYWALILGPLAGRLANASMVCYWKRVPFSVPRWKEIRAPIELGRQTAVGRLAWAAYNYSDGIIVGRVLGDTVLGFYRMSMDLASAPAEKVSTLLMRTAGPLFANVQSDLALVRRYYLIFVEILSLTVMPLMTGLVILAPLAIPLILGGKKWENSVAPLQFLAAFMILRTLETLTEQVLISQRATRLTMRISLLNLIVMPVAFYVMSHRFGTLGVAASWLVMTPITILPGLIILLRRINIPVLDFLAVLWPAVLSSSVMAIALGAMQRAPAIMHLRPYLSLAVQIAVGGGIYAFFLLLVFRGKVQRYINFIRDLRSGRTAAI